MTQYDTGSSALLPGIESVFVTNRFLLFGIALLVVAAIFTEGCDTNRKRTYYNQQVFSLLEEANSRPDDLRPIEKLITIATGRYSFGAMKATICLGELKHGRSLIVPVLIKLLDSDDPYRSREAAFALKNLRIRKDEGLYLIIHRILTTKSFREPDYICIRYLSTCGAEAAPILTRLRKEVTSEKTRSQEIIQEAIQQLEQSVAFQETKPQ